MQDPLRQAASYVMCKHNLCQTWSHTREESRRTAPSILVYIYQQTSGLPLWAHHDNRTGFISQLHSHMLPLPFASNTLHFSHSFLH
ncbi:hypothetical protein J6590_018718 [Homalodisca vitripennis]|nr:hypothetical protein J6590_018718 [Homalodisca vitripennis]